jgi:integrase
VLEGHRLRWKALLAECDRDLHPADFIFPRADDPAVPMTPGQITQRWRRWRGRLGLDGVRLHDLRHAMVTRLLDQGIPVHDVAARAGHANGNVTLAIYAHPTTEGARRAGDAAGL